MTRSKGDISVKLSYGTFPVHSCVNIDEEFELKSYNNNIFYGSDILKFLCKIPGLRV